MPLARRPPPDLAPTLATDLDLAAQLIANARAPATERAYRTDLAAWEAYALRNGLPVFPISPQAMCAFVASMVGEGLRPATIRRRVSALGSWHTHRETPSPVSDQKVRDLLTGLRRAASDEPPRKKRPLSAAMIRQMVALLDMRRPKDIRDRAILYTGFITGMRRSELAALEWRDVVREEGGMLLAIRKSKTDQHGKGAVTGLPRRQDGAEVGCPVAALELWGSYAEQEGGPNRPGGSVFGCTDRTIANVVKRHVKAIGKDPDEYSGHSLRRGFMTDGSRVQGVTLSDLMQQSRHKSMAIAQGYIAHGRLLSNPALLGLVEGLG